MRKIIKREPVATAALVRVLGLVAAAVGLDVTEGELDTFLFLGAAIADVVVTVVVRNRVTPMPDFSSKEDQ